MVFDQPQNWFAAYTPGLLSIRLYSQGSLFYTSNVAAEFNGVISDIPFDQVQVFDPGDSNINMDDMHFGAVPAPSALLIVAGTLLLRHSGRRRSCEL